MKFSIILDEQEHTDVFNDYPLQLLGKFVIDINGRKFECFVEGHQVNREGSNLWTRGRYQNVICGQGHDKKAEEIAQAKAEVNRTKEAHKEAQRKLSALMEGENGNS